MSELKPALTRLFGFADFRPGQEQVVRAAVDGRDTLALMPTGSGKSLTYQLAAMLRPTPTLVLSPLIALMKDQVDSLRTLGIADLSPQRRRLALAVAQEAAVVVVCIGIHRIHLQRLLEMLPREIVLLQLGVYQTGDVVGGTVVRLRAQRLVHFGERDRHGRQPIRDASAGGPASRWPSSARSTAASIRPPNPSRTSPMSGDAPSAS